MKQVFVARNPAEAHLIKGVLESFGIAAEVRAEALWGARGEIPLTPENFPSVWVLDDADEAEAHKVLETQAASRGTWRCPGCGEALEGQFTDCWKCGTARPD